jgi:hypothetical protein
MRTVRGAKGIIHKDIGQPGRERAKSASFLFRMKTQVLQHQNVLSFISLTVLSTRSYAVLRRLRPTY